MRTTLALVLVVAAALLSLTRAQIFDGDIDMTDAATYTYGIYPDNQMEIVVTAYDKNGVAVRLEAITANKTDITTCEVAGTGTITNPFRVRMKIDMDDDSPSENSCGMTMSFDIHGVKMYNWRFKAYTTARGTTTIRRGFIFSIQCNTSVIALQHGLVSTLVNFDVPPFTVTAANSTDITGPNSIATNAQIVYTGTIYPGGQDAFGNAEGIYFYSCYSATNANMDAQREEFIDANGCPVSGARFASTSGFTRVGDASVRPITIRAQYATATAATGNRNNIYMECLVDTCNTTSDPYCIDRCGNNDPGRPSTYAGSLSTSFVIQDQEAQVMIPTLASDLTNVLETSTVGTNIKITTTLSPGGIGASQAINNAKGFYVTSCVYATNKQFTNAVTFVNSVGCLVSSTQFSPSAEFVYDSLSSDPASNRYVLRSGTITLQTINQAHRRIWVKCNTNVCNQTGHNYCQKRCGATNNIPNGNVELGYQGLQFTMSITDPLTTPTIMLNVAAGDGELINNGKSVNVGDNLSFRVLITPGGIQNSNNGQINQISTAKAIFVYSCEAITAAGNRIPFIDENGCRVPGTPYTTSQECVEDTEVKGVPPFGVYCGTFAAADEGNTTQNCTIGMCTTLDNPVCLNRCTAGAITPSSNALNLGSTAESMFSAVVEDVGRTAIKAEEIRGIIIALTVVLPVAVIALIGIGACLMIRKQKKNMKV